MLVIFKSPAGADIMMFKENAKQILDLLGKDVHKGIITSDETGTAIATLEKEIERKKQIEAEEKAKREKREKEDQKQQDMEGALDRPDGKRVDRPRSGIIPPDLLKPGPPENPGISFHC